MRMRYCLKPRDVQADDFQNERVTITRVPLTHTSVVWMLLDGSLKVNRSLDLLVGQL